MEEQKYYDMLFGTPIYENKLLPEKTWFNTRLGKLVPAKYISRTKYKKLVPYIIAINGKIFTHPNNFDNMKNMKAVLK